MTTTVRVKASQITKDWHVIDASDRALGRVATEAATLLRGKHKPAWEPHLDVGDFVIVINASKIRLSGAKALQKVYYRHSGYPGGLKSRTFMEQLERDPTRIIEQAVFGMLPKGPLGKAVRRHLKVYAGAEHPHQSQVTGSERAAEARKEAEAVARREELESPTKPPRLRPFSRATVATPAAVPAPGEDVEEAPVATEVQAPESAATATPEAQAPVVDADETVEIETTAAETATADDAPAEEKKPARRSRAKKAEATEEPGAEGDDAAAESEE